jgi:hypothetical protein
MIVTADTLVDQSHEQLSSYLWRRLRLEAPLNPPLNDDKMGLEPPEEFIIRAVKARMDDEAFVARVHRVIQDHLQRLLPILGSRNPDPAASEQLTSLAFLAEHIGARPVVNSLHTLLLTQRVQYAKGDDSVLAPLQALADAVTTLAPTLPGKAFWETLVDGARDAGLRATAFDALVDNDLEAAMERLPRMVDDPDADVGLIAWNLSTTVPGPRRLGQYMARYLDRRQQDYLLDELSRSGADEKLIAEIRQKLVPDELEATGGNPPARQKWRHVSLRDYSCRLVCSQTIIPQALNRQRRDSR